MDNDVQRREWIKARIEAIHEELDKLLRELGAPETGIDEAEQRRRRFTIYKGGLGAAVPPVLSATCAAMRHRRVLAGTVAAAGAATMVATVVLPPSGPREPAPPRISAPRVHTVRHAHSVPHLLAPSPTAGRTAAPTGAPSPISSPPRTSPTASIAPQVRPSHAVQPRTVPLLPTGASVSVDQLLAPLSSSAPAPPSPSASPWPSARCSTLLSLGLDPLEIVSCV